MAMTKSVTVAELAEHLREHLAEVRDGTTLEIVEDGQTVAVFRAGIHYPRPGTRTGDFKPGPRPPNLKTDPAEIIIEERERRRSGEKYK